MLICTIRREEGRSGGGTRTGVTRCANEGTDGPIKDQHVAGNGRGWVDDNQLSGLERDDGGLLDGGLVAEKRGQARLDETRGEGEDLISLGQALLAGGKRRNPLRRAIIKGARACPLAITAGIAGMTKRQCARAPIKVPTQTGRTIWSGCPSDRTWTAPRAYWS